MITDFLQTKRTREELATTLLVIREFKKCESSEEWVAIPFVAWVKIVQLEEFLAHLVEDEPLKADTLEYMEGQK